MYLSQSSAAVSENGRDWLLLNASPDLAYQFASFPPLAPGALRGSAVAGVFLTDGEMDHVAGLLSLREQKKLRLVCTEAVQKLLTEAFPLLPALGEYCRVRGGNFPVEMAGIRVSALELRAKKPPRYSRHLPEQGVVAALRLDPVRGTSSLVYAPGLPEISERLDTFARGCSCVIADGTFWSDREMISLGLSTRTARQMGHVPISGRGGSLDWLRNLDVPRKIYTHINNSNPILREGSAERRRVERSGVEVSCDGMDIRL